LVEQGKELVRNIFKENYGGDEYKVGLFRRIKDVVGLKPPTPPKVDGIYDPDESKSEIFYDSYEDP